MDILGYYEDDSKNPIAFMNNKGIIVFKNDRNLKKYKKLGGVSELHKILSNLDYYKKTTNNGSKVRIENTSFKPPQSGGGGFFGESNGKCGWGDSPSCCFYDCAPLWRTNVWPFNITM